MVDILYRTNGAVHIMVIMTHQWVEDSSTCSSVEEGSREGGCDKFYDKLGPLYKPFPKEEASVAELLRDMNVQEESYALLVRSQEEASAAAASARSLQSPSESSPVSVGSPQKEVSVIVPDHLRDGASSDVPPSRHYCQIREFSSGFCVRSPPLLDLERSRIKRKRDRDEVECTSEGRKKLRTHEAGFVTPSVVPAFNWVSPEGFRAINAYLPSQRQPPRSEALKCIVGTEDEKTTEWSAGCRCSYGSKMVAGEMYSWRAFKLQHIISRRNRLWRSDELRTTLRHWHASLELDNPSSCTIALHMFHRRVHTLKTSSTVVRGLNVTILLAVSLWVAVKLVDNIAKVPKASILAGMAGVPVQLLTYAELPLLDGLRWKLVRY